MEKNNIAQKNIPQEWTLKRLGDVLDYERPDNYIVKSTSYANDRKTPVLTANKSFVLGYTDEDFGIYKQLPCVIFDDFTTDSKFVDFPFKVKSSAIKILKCKDESNDLKFIHEVMKLIDFPLGNHKRYYISQYQEIEILLPNSKIEQQKIAGILGAVDENIAKTQGVIMATEKLKKGLMQKLFTRGIGHTKFKKTKLGEIPEEWEVVTIQELIDRNIIVNNQDGNHGGSHPKATDYISSGIPFIAASDVRNGKIDLKNCHFLAKEQTDKLRIGFAKENDVLLTHKGSVGNIAVVPKLKTPYILLTPQVTYYRLNDNLINNIYLSYIFQSDYFQKLFKATSRQSTRDFLSITNQRRLLIPFSKDINEQKEIAEILSAVDEKISINKKLKNKLTLLKKGLMQDLLSGRVRV